MLAISAGAVLGGIIGALLAVPALAFLNSAIRVLAAPNPAVEAAAISDSGAALVADAKPDTVGPAEER